MVMNFWEAQRKARSKTTLYLSIFITLTLGVALGSEVVLRSLDATYASLPFPWVGLAFALLTFCVAGFQYASFSAQGGSYVAEMLGCRRVDPTTADYQEQKLLNIIHEMAVASSLPVPAVYIMNSQDINAFAAGISSKDAAIAVTRGTLENLSRDELQGVVAHEFGHIYNGDMKISLRLAAMIMGFYIAFILGLRMLQFGPRVRKKDKGGVNLYLVALVLLAAGALTWLFGSILKSCVSREREYLADACAVQFTRNPHGIANALRKIAAGQTAQMPAAGSAFTHMYFNDHSAFSSLFATHPPLEKRIAAIEGLTYLPPEWKNGLSPLSDK